MQFLPKLQVSRRQGVESGTCGMRWIDWLENECVHSIKIEPRVILIKRDVKLKGSGQMT